MKRYAVLDQYGVVAYELSGLSIDHFENTVVHVYSEDGDGTKALINLAPGHSIMEVCDVVGGERLANPIEGENENRSI